MSCWNKEQLENMLEDVVNELNLSEGAIEKHGPLGTAPADLVRLVLDQKDQIIKALGQGFVPILNTPAVMLDAGYVPADQAVSVKPLEWVEITPFTLVAGEYVARKKPNSKNWKLFRHPFRRDGSGPSEFLATRNGLHEVQGFADGCNQARILSAITTQSAAEARNEVLEAAANKIQMDAKNTLNGVSENEAAICAETIRALITPQKDTDE